MRVAVHDVHILPSHFDNLFNDGKAPCRKEVGNSRLMPPAAGRTFFTGLKVVRHEGLD